MATRDQPTDDRELVDLNDLVVAQQIAERFGLAQVQSVYNWIARHPDFPAPVWQFGRLRLWLWSEVRAWGIATGRLSGRA